MKRIMQLVILVCSLFIMTVTAMAATSSVIDTAKLLSTTDRAAVERSISQVEQKYGVRAAFVTIRDSKVTDLSKYANTVLDRNYRDGRNGNMVYVVNMATSKFYVADDNKMRQRISDSYGIKQVANSVAANLKDKNYKAAVLSYASQLDKQLSYYQTNGRAMTAPATAPTTAKATAPAPKKEKEHNIPMAAGGAILAGGLGAFTYGGSLKSSMSNVHNASRADQYMKPGSFKLSEKDDTFMFITYTRTPKPKRNDKDDDGGRNFVEESGGDDDHGGAGGSFGDDD